MKRSRRELSIDMVIHRGIFENNKITLFPCFTFIPKTGVSFDFALISKSPRLSNTLTKQEICSANKSLRIFILKKNYQMKAFKERKLVHTPLRLGLARNEPVLTKVRLVEAHSSDHKKPIKE